MEDTKISLLSDFFRGKKKVSLTPDITIKTPAQINPQAYGDLSTLAHKYTTGEGVGYGDEYVNKMTNPVAEASRRNFRNYTAPTISSNYSSRGLGKSSMAANAVGFAEQNVESDIDQMMAQFYDLNEKAKKSDIQYGAGLSERILGGDVEAQRQQAAASERLANATAAEQSSRWDSNNAKVKGLMEQAGQIVTPMVSSFVPNFSSMTGGTGGVTTASKVPTGSTTKILGASNQDFEAWLNGMFGG